MHIVTVLLSRKTSREGAASFPVGEKQGWGLSVTGETLATCTVAGMDPGTMIATLLPRFLMTSALRSGKTQESP